MENHNLLFFCTMCRNKSPEEIAKINCTIEHSVRHYKKGEYVAYQGDRVSSLYLLSKGTVKTEIVSESGLTLPVKELTAPYPLAAAFLFANDNFFPVDVIAIEDCEIMLISKQSVEKQMSKCPGFLRGFMAFNANRILHLSERLKMFAQKSIKSKIAYYILQKEKNGNFDFEQSISSLAEYFGVERPSLSRAISEMVKDRIIEFKAGKGKILNRNAICEL